MLVDFNILVVIKEFLKITLIIILEYKFLFYL